MLFKERWENRVDCVFCEVEGLPSAIGNVIEGEYTLDQAKKLLRLNIESLDEVMLFIVVTDILDNRHELHLHVITFGTWLT